MSEYIEKKAVLAYLINVKVACLSNKEFEAYEKLVRMIGEIESGKLPAADVEPVRHGHWEQIDETKCRCSCCDIIALIGLYPHGDKNYCPNCGAEMKDGDKNG